MPKLVSYEYNARCHGYSEGLGRGIKVKTPGPESAKGGH